MPTDEASDTNDMATTSSRPTWDCSPNTLPAFVEAITKWLPKKNSNYRNLVEQGCRVEGRKTIFYNVNHINRYANNEIKNSAGQKGTFRAPVLVDASQNVALLTPRAILYAISPTETSGELKLSESPYDTNPLSIDNLLRNMFDDITAGWDDQDTIDEYEESCGGHGSKLLVQLDKDSTAARSNAGAYGESIDSEIDAAFLAGIEQPTVTAFKALKSKVSKLRRLLPADNQLSNAKFSYRLATAARGACKMVDALPAVCRHMGEVVECEGGSYTRSHTLVHSRKMVYWHGHG